MTDFSLKTARAIGTPTETTWAQAHAFSDIFFIVVLERPEGSESNLPASGKQFFVHFEQVYQQELAAGAGKKNLDTFKSLIQKTLDGGTDVVIASFAAGMVSTTGLLYLATKNGEVRIKRSSTTKKILSGEEIVFASGFLEDGDVVILLSADLANGLDTGDVFSSDDPEEIAEAVSASIHKASLQERQVAFLAKAKRALGAVVLGEKEAENLAQPKVPGIITSLLGNAVKGKIRRVAITVFLLLIVLFISSLFLGVNKRHEEQAKARFAQAYEQASQKYDEGMVLADLNPTLAQKTLREAKDIAQRQIDSFKEKSEEKEKLVDLNKKIDEGLRVALRIATLSDVPLFFDLTLIKDNASGTTMSAYEGKMVILDDKNGAAYTLTVESKKSDLISGALSGVKKEAIGVDSAYLLGEEGIEKVSLATKKRALSIKKDDSWGEIGEMVSFAGNLYVLDKSNGSIYKYQGSGDSFSQRRDYLASDVKPDFSDSVSMVIDGSVWVLFSDGRISKFAQGALQNFSIDGIDTPLSSPASLFTDDESEHLYILDRANLRIVVVKKDGTYTSQYQWEGIKDVSDIVVSEKAKKILLLSGSKIFVIDIK